MRHHLMRRKLPPCGSSLFCSTSGTKLRTSDEQNNLDNTSSVVVTFCSMPKKNALAGFAYEIVYKGKIIRCRTLDDMQRVLENLEGSRVTKEITPWSTDEFERFTGRIQFQQ